ncbi:ABC transporter ATP-binding protein [Loigolactobacillus binensis]|uniref:ABC transporter ATP-binding protein n=1 Tax=Loigolactobacillus binensis TaxID=2559922 RepID=A0ABW3EEK9_9LACO|nr:ABC transporter ATP-binding protein [Loigolactobacillus binensis]
MQLTLQDITLAYERQPPIFTHFNCTVPDGELVALLGPSGSGKTTILNLIAGLLTPTAGQVLFANTDVTKQNVRTRNIGMVFQDYALYPHFNVLDNIAFPLKMAHVKKARRQQRVRELAQLVHVTELVDKFPSMLSGGQQQRVAIARALAKNPAILLLDEPLSNLDAALRNELRDEIRRIQQAIGITTLFVTHDQADALRIADKIIVLANGQLQQSGTGTDLYRRPRNLFVAQFIGTPQINTLPIAALLPYITTAVPTTILAQTAMVGIRSEAISLTPTDKIVLTKLPVTVTKQEQLGREVQTYSRYQKYDLISTAIPVLTPLPQSAPLYITAKGCYLFASDGTCIWAGGDA